MSTIEHSHHAQEPTLIEDTAVEVALTAPNARYFERPLSVEEIFAREAVVAQPMGAAALRKLYEDDHISTTADGLFAPTHEHAQPTLY